MLVDKQLPSLTGGVSQQPATVRLPSQAEEIKNAWLSVADGAGTRNPTEHIVKITSDNLSGAFLHTINRDTTERYLVVLDGTSVRVFDLDGNEKTVTPDIGGTLEEFFAATGSTIDVGDEFPTLNGLDTDDGELAEAKGSALVDGTGEADWFRRTGASTIQYVGTITASNPLADLSIEYANLTAFLAAHPSITVGTTFKLSEAVPIPLDFTDNALETAKGAAIVDGDYFYVASSSTVLFTHNPNTSAVIYDGTGGYNYLESSNPTQDFVCVTVADYTFILNRDVIVRLAPIDGTAGSSTRAQNPRRWTMVPRYPGEESDGPTRRSLGGYTGQRARRRQYDANPTGGTLVGTVQTFQDLPEGASSGDIYKIEGSADSAFTTYYVRSAGDNTWFETVKPGLRNRIRASTMPHALVRNADGTFSFGQFSWADRMVGDEDTNANPAFVGREIRDIFWYKNRFGCAVDEGVVLTRVGDFGNFYRLTVVDLLDDERVDVQASETKVTKINYAVPFDGSIMLFSDQTQLRLNHGAEGLTPTNATLDVVTNFRMVENVRPFALGSDVYFAGQNGDWAAIREYFVAPDSQVNDAANVTSHVPEYIPDTILRLSGSDVNNVLLVLAENVEGAPQELYVYNFHWVSETEKAQSAWNKWTFLNENTFLAAELIDNDIYVLAKRSDGAHLEKITLAPGAEIEDLGFQIYLDRRTHLAAGAGTYDAGNDWTTWTLPYATASGSQAKFLMVDDSDGTLLESTHGSYTFPTSTTVRLAGNHSATGVYAGVVYEFRYEFSEQFARNQQDVPMLNGRLNVRNWTVYFKDTAFFKVEVAPYGVSAATEEVIPALKADGQVQTETRAYFETNAPEFVTGQHTFGVYGDSDEATVAIVSESPYGALFTQSEWEGFYHKRSRTI
jgi:hypothetical protein